MPSPDSREGLERLARRIALGHLTRIEWVADPTGIYCQICRAPQPRGHRPDCGLAHIKTILTLVETALPEVP